MKLHAGWSWRRKIPRTSTSESKMKKALITGVTGQDGAYLAEFLLKKTERHNGKHKMKNRTENSDRTPAND